MNAPIHHRPARRVRPLLGALLTVLLVLGVTGGVANAATARPAAITYPPTGSWTSPKLIDTLSVYSPYHGLVEDISCPSAGNCVAVGQYVDADAFVVEEKAGTWGSPQLFNQEPGNWEVFYAVSCSSAGNCAVVGADGNDGVLLDEHAGVWGTPSIVSYGLFDAVSCSAAGECVAGGTALVGPTNVVVAVVTEHSGTWGSPQALLDDGSAFGGQLNAIDCPTTGHCVAVGAKSPDSSDAFLVDEVSGTWDPVHFVDTDVHDPHDDPLNYVDSLISVSCSSAGNCSAGGYYGMYGKTGFPFVISETGGSWTAPARVTTPPGGEGVVTWGGDQTITSVSCPSDGNCTAVGFYWDTNADSHLLALREVGGTWGLAAAELAPQVPEAGGPSCSFAVLDGSDRVLPDRSELHGRRLLRERFGLLRSGADRVGRRVGHGRVAGHQRSHHLLRRHQRPLVPVGRPLRRRG